MEWKMELNSEHTKLQLSRVTGMVLYVAGLRGPQVLTVIS